MRTIFFVLSISGYEPAGALYYLPTKQPLSELLEIALALLRRQGVEDLYSAEDFTLWDLYGERLNPSLLVCHVPFPGCVIVVSRTDTTQAGDGASRDEEAAVTASSIAMQLMAQREDAEDKLLTKYARYLREGGWRFEPTPITDFDVGVTCHAENGALARRLVDLLEARGLRCQARVANVDGSSEGIAAGRSPAQNARALVVMISQSTSAEPWLAYDTGAAWVEGIPVVPVLVGAWTTAPPDILAPYQRLNWEAQHERVVDDLVELLDLTPWTAIRERAAAAKPRTSARSKARRRPGRRRSPEPPG